MRKLSLLIRIYCCRRFASTTCSRVQLTNKTVSVYDKKYAVDDCTNVTPRILSFIGKNLHNRQYHPINLMKQNIINYFSSNFIGRSGNSTFSVYDDIYPVVSIYDNFDSLLVPKTHPSREKTDCYYINRDCILRAHMTAHQAELIRMGLDNFLIIGDCYRKDEIDNTHYPVFHQADGVYTLSKDQIENAIQEKIEIFDSVSTEDNEQKQKVHTIQASKFIEKHLKDTLTSLIHHVYKKKIDFQWVSEYFPFTHPSWELQIQVNNQWVETLGCGIIRHEILKEAGAGDRIGWAFGLGLERLAMQRYQIPDIRTFWSDDSGFTCQFEGATPDKDIKYKEVSIHPPCIMDMSFWLSKNKIMSMNDFCDIVRSVGGNIVEQVRLIDEFHHPGKKRTSRTYRIVYRHMEKPLSKEEANEVHVKIGNHAIRNFGVELR